MTHTISKEVTFEEGDMVTWINPDDPIIVKYGTGPFQVIEIIPVPMGMCSCGMSIDDHNHSPFCGRKTTEGLVGHSQWLIIQKDGEVIKDDTAKPQRFSGKWFKKVNE